MSDRKVMEAKMEAKIAEGEAKLKEMKADLVAAGDGASDEAKKAVKSAEKLLDASKKKFTELSSASDEKFDSVVADARETWDELSAQVEGGWDALSGRIKKMFS